MMQSSYKSNYIQIYLWRSLSIVVSFFSFLIVIPYLSSRPEIYGIYTFCTTFQMYLSYADIGFLSAGQKYAAEAFARGDRKEEINILGFVGAVLIAMIVPFSVLMVMFAINPSNIINGVEQDNISLVSKLLLIMAIVSPFQVILQRLTQSILIIRVKDYIASRIDIIGSILKILSVFVFFTKGNYMIVPYFVFINVVTIVCSLLIIVYIKKTEKYDFCRLLRSMKFTRKYFDYMKKMSFTALGLTISWVLCYELDLVFIGKIFSVADVAQYAVCLSLINFIRNLLNVVYGPFSQRFNHYVALNDKTSFRQLLLNLVKYTFPLCIFISAILFFSASYFVPFWVGDSYEFSIRILKVLCWFFIFHFITQPGNYICTSTEQYKLLNTSSILSPLVFALSFGLFYIFDIGVLSFAYAKLTMTLASAFIMVIAIRKYINVFNVIRSFLPSVILILVMGISCSLIYPLIFQDINKSTVSLIELAFIMGVVGVIYFGGTALMDNDLRRIIVEKIKKQNV